MPYRDHSDPPGSGHRNSDMSIQLAPGPDDGYGGSQRGRGGGGRAGTVGNARPMSVYGGGYGEQQFQGALRQRSKSVSDGRQFNRDGRPILHFGTSNQFSRFLVKLLLTISSTSNVYVSSCYSRGAKLCKGRCTCSSKTPG
jgi:hypothetical protein